VLEETCLMCWFWSLRRSLRQVQEKWKAIKQAEEQGDEGGKKGGVRSPVRKGEDGEGEEAVEG
jgi:hypothetical protein